MRACVRARVSRAGKDSQVASEETEARGGKGLSVIFLSGGLHASHVAEVGHCS